MYNRVYIKLMTKDLKGNKDLKANKDLKEIIK